MTTEKKAPARLLALAVTLLALGSCLPPEGGGEASTAVFVFRDAYTGAPVAGVVMGINGQARTSDAGGEIDTGVAAGALLAGYVDPAALGALSYRVADPPPFDLPDYFAFTVPAAFTHTFYLAPQNPPPGFTVSGVAHVKGSASTPITSNGGEINVYTAWGARVACSDIDTGSGAYAVDVPAGNQVFVVTEYTYPEYTTYYVLVSVAANATVDLSYTAADITLSGSTDATIVYADLRLAGALVNVAMGWADGAFSVNAPYLPGSAIRLRSVSEFRSGDGRELYLRQDYASGASGIALNAASGSTVPDPWTANLTWDETSQTLTWSPAGNATAYEVWIGSEGPSFQAVVRGSPLVVPAAFDIASPWGYDIRVTPIWSDGAVPPLAPDALAATTVIRHYSVAAGIFGGGGGESVAGPRRGVVRATAPPSPRDARRLRSRLRAPRNRWQERTRLGSLARR